MQGLGVSLLVFLDGSLAFKLDIYVILRFVALLSTSSPEFANVVLHELSLLLFLLLTYLVLFVLVEDSLYLLPLQESNTLEQDI